MDREPSSSVPGKIDRQQRQALEAGIHDNPFSVLGLHEEEGQFVLRAFVPGAQSLSVSTLAGVAVGTLSAIGDAGFFCGSVNVDQRMPLRLSAQGSGTQWQFGDPYSHGPVLGPTDDYLMAEGSHMRLYDKFGAHVMEHEGVKGVHFALWAPNASRVSVVGDFNIWDGRRHVMRKRNSGVWEIFIPDIGAGAAYKYEILDRDGQRLPHKSDPFAFQCEVRPRTASIVPAPFAFKWNDDVYMADRAQRDLRRAPMSIYEVHVGSWRRAEDNRFLDWDELADQLIPYAKELGFTHLELMPISEHPFDPSWGYQTTGLFAPTSRFGTPQGFARFVDRAHQAGIGVLLDWVPGHFPTDEHGLREFDGTALYEHADPRQGYHPDWNTAIYNFGRKEVEAFLVNNALYWAEKFHLDGIRVDAVASMLYLDYSREEGEWVPNKDGGRENLEAISFLQRTNSQVYGASQGFVTIAEESTAFPGVTTPVHEGGLGFGFKWNMGFMHDTLAYMGRDAAHRKYHHNDLTFGLLYAFSENFVLPLSHDEVVHGKGSLLNKMSGDDWQKFATLRSYYAFMWGYPGKKLLFMGQEFAQRDEWSESRSLDWHLCEFEPHSGMQRLIGDLNRAYQELPALYARDCEHEGFEWLVVDDHDQSVLAWLRKSADSSPVAVVSNFTPVPRENYRIGLPLAGRWIERVNTDANIYGGSGIGNLGEAMALPHEEKGFAASASLTLPPLGSLILEYQPS